MNLIYNQTGKVSNIAPKNKASAMGLYGNIFGYQNQGKFKNRFYSLSDSSQGLDRYSRELIVRWSREMVGQLPIVSSAIKVLSQFSIDDAYLPFYKGSDTEWGKIATDWLINDWYPNCCTRGSAYDFRTVLDLTSQAADTDGDQLVIYGQSSNGFPLIQIIPSHRLSSTSEHSVINEGEFKGCVISDGIVYTMAGKAVGYCVQNSQNMVNSMVADSPERIFSTKESRLIFEPRYFDKNRGIPAIASAILQAISIQELDGYLIDKVKIETMIALIEKNQSGEAPQELQDTMAALLAQTNNANSNPLAATPNQHAVQVVNGPEIRYVKSDGGDIKTLASSTPGDETSNYMTKLETQILMTIGVPHQLVFSTQNIGGRVTGAAAEIFRKSISKRQLMLDSFSRSTIGWAISKAMKSGLIPENNKENMLQVFDVTHPNLFTLDAKYDSQIVIDNLASGIATLGDSTQRLFNRSAFDTIQIQKQEAIDFYTAANEVSKVSGRDINMVISEWKQTPLKVTSTIKSGDDSTSSEE